MTKNELNIALENHAKWLESEGKEGMKADLRGADLSGADLRAADLRRADLRWANLSGADLCWANLCWANLRKVDLRAADLREADLRGANLDYSVWPLWCGSLGVMIDARIAAQLAYHFCHVECDDPEYLAARAALKVLANKCHRAEECGKIE